MKLTIFKPNPSGNGGLISLKVGMTKNDKKDLWSKTLFVEFVPQKGWDSSKKTGSFDVDKKRIVAINTSEAGEMLYTMDTKAPFQNYHQSGDRSCWIKFAHFDKKRTNGREGDKGFWQGTVDNFAIGYSEKGANVNIPISSGEARELKLLLEAFIKESMALDAKEEERKFKSKAKTQEKEKSDPEGDFPESEEEESDGGGADDGSDDIPFAQFWEHSPMPL